jgi:hypothetical protein
MSKADPSTFFRLNEEIARELSRLERSGALDRLLELLDAGRTTLRVSSVRESEGLEELLGVLSPRQSEPAPEVPVALGLAPVRERLGGCASCGEEPPAERVLGVRGELERPRGGFDHEGYMTVRSQFLVLYPDGEACEVYMPDQLCPVCWNEAGNAISECARICGSCKFAW